MNKNLRIFLSVAYFLPHAVQSFQVTTPRSLVQGPGLATGLVAPLASTSGDGDSKEKQVGNLLADDEWEGLGMELTELVRTAEIEDLKRTSREFLGKEDYKGKDSCSIATREIMIFF